MAGQNKKQISVSIEDMTIILERRFVSEKYFIITLFITTCLVLSYGTTAMDIRVILQALQKKHLHKKME